MFVSRSLILVAFLFVQIGIIGIDFHEDSIANDHQGGPGLPGDFTSPICRASQRSRCGLHERIG